MTRQITDLILNEMSTSLELNEQVVYRWKVTKKLGKGSLGVVLKCYDHKEHEYVALKILKNKKRLYKQGLVEAKLIRHLNEKDPRGLE